MHCSKFANDTKLGGVAATPDGCAAMQRDLDRLENGAERSIMKLNMGKCKVLPVGRNNPRHQYMLEAERLEKHLCREGFGGSGGQQIVHESAMHLHGKKGQEHPGLH